MYHETWLEREYSQHKVSNRHYCSVQHEATQVHKLHITIKKCSMNQECSITFKIKITPHILKTKKWGNKIWEHVILSPISLVPSAHQEHKSFSAVSYIFIITLYLIQDSYKCILKKSHVIPIIRFASLHNCCLAYHPFPFVLQRLLFFVLL